MIRVQNLYKAFDGQPVLEDINVEIKKGEIVVIFGESGTGKTVLLKHMIGLLRPDRGSIEIGGVDITQLPEKELLKVRKDIGYLFQEGALYDFMDVFDNIAFPLREHTKLNTASIYQKVKNILSVVGLRDVDRKLPSELSGGMKKRVGLARALILDSHILFCDEPTSGLDPIRSRDISDLIRTISKSLNCTTVITSHDVANSFRIADRLIVLQGSRVVTKGTPEELKTSHNAFVREFVA